MIETGNGEETKMMEETQANIRGMDMEKTTLTVKQKQPRTRLFQTLEAILTFAEEKRKTANLADKTKQSWARISITAIATYGTLLKDCELESINERLEELERKQEIASYGR